MFCSNSGKSVDGFDALYQAKDTKLPAVFVAMQAVLANI